MTVSDELLENGYCILRECLPRQQLDSLRTHCEEMLARHRTWWADHREPGEPPGGERECDAMERAFRAMIDRDAAAFCEALGELHSGEVGGVSCLIQLSKIARAALRGRGPVGGRLTAAEAGQLWRRFETFDRLLQVEEPHLVPGFQGKQPSTYRFQEMPDIDVDGFIAGWQGRTRVG